MAASPHDSEKVAAGVPYDKINPSIAIPACREAVERNPKVSRLWFQYGRALEKGNKVADAIIAYQEAIKFNHAAALNNIGELYRDGKGFEKNLKKAGEFFTKASLYGSTEGATNLDGLYTEELSVKQPRADASWRNDHKLRGLEGNKSVEIIESESFLNFALGKKWSVLQMPCDLNGGTYQIYDREIGYRFTTAGKESINQARTDVEYVDLGSRRFKLIQNFYSNDFVEKMLGERNVISARLEWTVERLSKSTMRISKKNTQLNFDLLLKGLKKYDITTETSSENRLCSA